MSAILNPLSQLFERRFRGARLIEIIGLALAVVMILWICLSKVREGEDVKRLNALNAEIASKTAEVNQLKLTVSHLERPGRLESLAKNVLSMGSQPEREADMDALSEISRTGTRVETPVHAGAGSTPAASLDLVMEAGAAHETQTAPTPVVATSSRNNTKKQLVIEVTDPNGGHR